MQAPEMKTQRCSWKSIQALKEDVHFEELVCFSDESCYMVAYSSDDAYKQEFFKQAEWALWGRHSSAAVFDYGNSCTFIDVRNKNASKDYDRDYFSYELCREPRKYKSDAFEPRGFFYIVNCQDTKSIKFIANHYQHQLSIHSECKILPVVLVIIDDGRSMSDQHGCQICENICNGVDSTLPQFEKL